jgi:hypothetical protein
MQGESTICKLGGHFILSKDEPETDYPVKFKSKPLVQKYEDPYKQAEYAYSLIESEV